MNCCHCQLCHLREQVLSQGRFLSEYRGPFALAKPQPARHAPTFGTANVAYRALALLHLKSHREMCSIIMFPLSLPPSFLNIGVKPLGEACLAPKCKRAKITIKSGAGECWHPVTCSPKCLLSFQGTGLLPSLSGGSSPFPQGCWQ